MGNIIFSEGSGVTNSIFGKSQEPIKAFLEKRGEAFEAESVLPLLFNMEESSNFAEKYTTMTAMEGFKPVGENGEYPIDGNQEGFSKYFEHDTWKNSFSLSKEIIDDAKAMDLKRQPEAFIASYYRTRELLGAALYGTAIGGGTSVKFRGKTYPTTGADGLPVFSKVHRSATKSSYTQSNLFADAFSVDALSAGETKMQLFADDDGNLLDISPDTIVIPNLYQLKKAVFAAVGADKDPATSNNGFNYQYGRWNIVVWSYLNQYITANTAPWILFDSKANGIYGGANWLDREKLTVRSTLDENTDANVWRGRARFVAGFNDWRPLAVFGVTGGTQAVPSAN